MTGALTEIRDLAAQFAAGRLRPAGQQWDHDRALDPAVAAELAGLGFAGLLVPEAQGGLGLDEATLVAAVEELAWGEPVFALVVGAAAALAAALRDTPGSDVLKAVAAGRTPVWVQLAHEARHSPTLRAVRDAEGWRMSGSVSWLLDGGPDGLLLLVADTEPGPGLFMVPASAPGVRIADRIDTLGLRAGRILALSLEDVHVPATSLVADAARVGRVLVRCETVERLVAAAVATGIARAALEHARDYADTREQFGRRLRQFEGIRVKLADMAGRVAAARALVAGAAERPEPASAAQAKVVASETAMQVTTDAVQIFGGYGYMRDYPVEKLMRDAKATELLMGANDGLRTLVVNAMYTN